MFTMNLKDKAMLVDLRMGVLGNSKKDLEITRETNQLHGVQSDMGRYTKDLVDKAVFKRIGQIQSAASTSHKFYTMPWNDKGVRLLPSNLYTKYHSAIAKHKQDFAQAVQEFGDGYLDAVKAAKSKLNGAFKSSDYYGIIDDGYGNLSLDPVRKVTDKFHIGVTPYPFPESGDFRLDLSADDVAVIKAQAAEEYQSQLEGAIQSIWRRLIEVVKDMATRLGNYKRDADGKVEGTFRDSVVTNIREVLNLVPALNLTGDLNIAAFADVVQVELANVSPNTLRDDDAIREATIRKAEIIAKQMSEFIQ